ncbi:MAG: electron transfer flavoprotein subunit alpha/FixB family protein [Thermoplasmata archaeon]
MMDFYPALPTEGIDQYHDVWVYIENRNGNIKKVGLELLGVGRGLADKINEKLVAVIMGYQIDGKAEEIIKYGADRVYVADHITLKDYRTEPYAEVFTELIKSKKPSILLIGATKQGRDIASRIAVKVRTGSTADCTMFDVDPERKLLKATRPTFGGKQLATIICDRHRPQIATGRPGTFKPLPYNPDRTGVVEKVNVNLKEEDLLVKLVKFIPKEEADLENAKIIVAGGRGLKGKDGFAMLKVFANEVGGVVGSSRVAVEEGWIEKETQVGQTGRSVSPDVYIACGISGAVQHITGITGSKIIIAINNDPNAEIFQYSDYGIVGDVFVVIPKLIELVRKYKSSNKQQK